jgi:CHASE2 domain-containing sensor protein
LAGGEAVGNAIGMPIAGTLAGGGVSGAIENTLNQITPRAIRAGIIKRTAEGAVKQGLGEAAGKVGVMAGVNALERLPQNIKAPTSALSIPVNQMNNETAVQEVEADAKPIVKGLNIQLSNGKIYKFPNSQALQDFMKEAGL